MRVEMLRFECVGMKDGDKFPIAHTGRGENISPEFRIGNLSLDARTLMITLEDLSHPIRNFTHWVIWNIPAVEVVPGAIPAGKTVPALCGARQGIAYGFHRYAGPKPPRGKSHRYGFTVYALDGFLSSKASATKRDVLREARGHVLQQGRVCGYFE